MDEARETQRLVWEKVGVLELGGPRWKIEIIRETMSLLMLMPLTSPTDFPDQFHNLTRS